MLERLRSLGQQRPDTSADPESFPGAATTVEPLPPADALVPEENRPTIRQIPSDVRQLMNGSADQIPASGVTSKLERVPAESTPAPLPPSPEAEQAAASWFESVPTSPAAPGHIGPLSPGTDSGVGSIPPVRRRDGAQLSMPPTRPITHTNAPFAGGALGDRPWTMPALIAATALAVGMVLGALIFGGGDDSTGATATRDAGVCAPGPQAATNGDSVLPGNGLTD